MARASVDCEAVEQSGAARANQIVLAAAPARVRGVPGLIVGAAAVEMTELRGACCFARPVAAGMIGGIFKGSAVGLRACQHVVLIGCVPAAGDCATLLSQPGNFPEVVAEAREIQGIPVQIGKVIGDLFAFGVVPGATADAVSGIDGVRALRAQVGVEGFRAPRRGRERLADFIGARQATKVGPMAGTGARDEKAHGLRRSLCGLLRECQERPCDRQRDGGNNKVNLLHSCLLRNYL
jgi:hypothetical protein